MHNFIQNIIKNQSLINIGSLKIVLFILWRWLIPVVPLDLKNDLVFKVGLDHILFLFLFSFNVLFFNNSTQLGMSAICLQIEFSYFSLCYMQHETAKLTTTRSTTEWQNFTLLANNMDNG